MTLESNKAVARRYLEDVWNASNMQAADDLIAPEFSFLSPAGKTDDLPTFKQYVQKIHQILAGLHFSVENLIAEGDQVLLEWTMTGTHTAEFMGIPASGKAVNVAGVSLLRISGGKLVTCRLYWDRVVMLQQIGVKITPA